MICLKSRAGREENDFVCDSIGGREGKGEGGMNGVQVKTVDEWTNGWVGGEDKGRGLGCGVSLTFECND